MKRKLNEPETSKVMEVSSDKTLAITDKRSFWKKTMDRIKAFPIYFGYFDTPPTTLRNLPKELFSEIFSFLDKKNLLSLRLVNRNMNEKVGYFFNSSLPDDKSLLNASAIQEEIQKFVKTIEDKNDLFEKQEAEIEFLGKHLKDNENYLGYKFKPATSLTKDGISPKTFQSMLDALPKDNSNFSLYMRHCVLNRLNEAIIIGYHQSRLSFDNTTIRPHIGKECDFTGNGDTPCYLTRLPNQVFNRPEMKEYWKSIRTLYIADNGLQKFPMKITEKLPSLRNIDAQRNYISELPSDFPPSLTFLDARHSFFQLATLTRENLLTGQKALESSSKTAKKDGKRAKV